MNRGWVVVFLINWKRKLAFEQKNSKNWDCPNKINQESEENIPIELLKFYSKLWIKKKKIISHEHILPLKSKK